MHFNSMDTTTCIIHNSSSPHAAFAAIAGEFFYPVLVSLESLKCEHTAEVMTRRTWKNHSSFFRTGMGRNDAMGESARGKGSS